MEKALYPAQSSAATPSRAVPAIVSTAVTRLRACNEGRFTCV